MRGHYIEIEDGWLVWVDSQIEAEFDDYESFESGFETSLDFSSYLPSNR